MRRMGWKSLKLTTRNNNKKQRKLKRKNNPLFAKEGAWIMFVNCAFVCEWFVVIVSRGKLTSEPFAMEWGGIDNQVTKIPGASMEGAIIIAIIIIVICNV